ncbi:MAG: hypothetical protein JO303_09295 [Caulobacteraceae bacterium]|nr:hypothetical protein [Caulobacteraceae bacterium]
MNTMKKTLLVAMGLLAAGVATGASAETRWDYNHPRRFEVNERLHNQNLRIRDKRREGEINGVEAARLHRADYRIRMQERRFARHDDGHISRREQIRLNHEENRVSRRIGD